MKEKSERGENRERKIPSHRSKEDQKVYEAIQQTDNKFMQGLYE